MARLSAFVVLQRSNKPAPGVSVQAVAEDVPHRRFAIGLLDSDHRGYVSFVIPALKGAVPPVRYWLFRFGENTDGVEAFADGEPVYLTVDGLPQRRSSAPLPALQGASGLDLRNSPGSFAVNPPLVLGTGTCEQFEPVDLSVREFPLIQVGRDLKGTIESIRPVEGGKPLPIVQHVREGWVNDYKVSWHHIGHSLGKLLYSLPLAPCESVNLAVVEWSRRDEGLRDERGSFSEDVAHELRRDRTVEETVNASLEEWQGGGSILGGIAGSYGADSGMSVSGALGFGYSTSSGERGVEGETLQQLADRIVQASSAIRDLHSTVVVTASQEEREVVQTRTITNHNHCHALTVLYYEVLRHFRVVTEWVRRRHVLLLQYPTYDFSEDFVMDHRVELERVLRDRRLLGCFRALARKRCADLGLIDSGQPIPSAEDVYLDQVTFVVRTGPQQPQMTLFSVRLDTVSGWVSLRALLTDLPDATANDRDSIMRSDRVTEGWITEFATPAHDKARLIPLRPQHPVRASEIRSIQILSEDDDGRWVPAHVFATTTHGANTWVLYDGDNDRSLGVDGDTRSLILNVLPGPGSTPVFELTGKEKCCVHELLAHLRANAVYYSRAIWLREDANTRAIRFDALPYRDSRLLDYIENRPVAVLGDWVAFPRRPLPKEIDEVVDPLPDAQERHVALPTRGIFAEAKLSDCNACEEKDVTRFWDWTESPCPDKAPSIAPIGTGSRAQSPELQPSAMPSSIVNIVNPPPAPDPSGMTAALSVLATPEIFRNMSMSEEVGGLLKSLAEGTISLEQASNRARDIKGKQGTSAGSRGGAPGGGSRPSPEEQHDQLQVYRNARAHGELTPEQAESLSQSYLEGAQYSGESSGEMLELREVSNPYGALGFDELSLAAGAGAVTSERVVRLIGATYDPAGKYKIPDTTAGPGGGWWVDNNRPRWIDFWRRPVDATRPEIYQLIEALQEDRTGSVALSITAQLDRLASQSMGLDVALTLATAWRESGPVILGRGNYVTSFGLGGLDFLGDVTDDEGRVVRGGELATLKSRGYLRRNFPSQRAERVRNAETGNWVYPVLIRADTIIEATGAVLNYRRDAYFLPRARTRGLDPDAASLDALRLWQVAFFARLDASEVLDRLTQAGGANLDAALGNADLQRFDIIKRGHITAAEAEILDVTLLTESRRLADLQRAGGPIGA